MNYFKLLDRVGFHREKIAKIPYTNGKIVDYIVLSESESYENTHRYYISWSYKVNNDLSIWINTYKMTTYKAWIIDPTVKPTNYDYLGSRAVLEIHVDRRHINTINDNMWENILYSLPEKYEYVGQQILRQIQINRLF